MNVTAINSIYLNEDTGGKGRFFKSRFLQAGLVKYQFGVCLLKKETIDKFVNTFIGCPVVINHQDVTDESAKEQRVGVISRVYFEPSDAWFWCEGVLFDNEAIDLVQKGYTVSCQYEITEYSDNSDGELHNGNPYDKEILDGRFEHLAIVDSPRYEDAIIAVNAICKNSDDEDDDTEWITVKGNHIPVMEGQSKDEAIQDFIEEKSKGGYSDKNKSNRAIAAEVKGKDNISNLAKKLGVKSSEINGVLWSGEWHHTNKNYTETKYYHTDAYMDLKKDGEISQQTIKKYDLNEFEIEHIQTSWNKFKNKSKLTSEQILEPFIKKYQEDKQLLDTFQQAMQLKKRTQWEQNYNPEGEIRRFIEEYRNNPTEYNKKHLKEIIEFNSTKSIEERKKKQKATNEYQPIIDYIENYKEGAIMNEETKKLFGKLISALTARNEADDAEKDKKDDKASNDGDDKRAGIDKVAGILKSAGADEETIRTCIGIMEKLAYDKSEAGTADNKAKNEDEDPKDEKKDDKKEEKAENEEDDKKEPEKKEEKKDEKAENKKAKNSMDALKKLFYEGAETRQKQTYMTQKQAIELGKKLF